MHAIYCALLNKLRTRIIQQYKQTNIKLTDNQILLRDEINYQKTFKTSNETTLSDIAFAISDTKQPITIVVLRNNEQITLNVEIGLRERERACEEINEMFGLDIQVYAKDIEVKGGLADGELYNRAETGH